MRLRSGSALLAVTFLGFLILGLGIVLVSISTDLNRASYSLNRMTVCRYAADGALHEIMFRVKREADTNTPGWFDQARQAPDPVLTLHIPRPLSANPLKLQGPDTPQVQVSILNAAEAATSGTVLTANEYIIQAAASLDGFKCVRHMRMTYGTSTAGGDQTNSTSGGFAPSQLFSKYVLWTHTGINDPSSVFTVDFTTDGMVHFDGDAFFGNKQARFAMPVTATGTLGHVGPPFVASPWTQAEKDKLFDFDGNGSIGMSSRPQYNNTSEADAKAGSGGGKPPVQQPAVAEVENRFLEAAVAQSSDPGLARLWVDSANPIYKSGGSMYVGASIQSVSIKLEHDLLAKVTRATLTVRGSSSTKTATVDLPSGTPIILLTRSPISNLGGTYFANLTIATTYQSSSTSVNQYGSYNSLYSLPTMQVQSTPALKITDHLICVDQEGRPKYWVQGGDPSTLPQPFEDVELEIVYSGSTSDSSSTSDSTSGSGSTSGSDSTTTVEFDPWGSYDPPPPSGSGQTGGHLPPKRPCFASMPGVARGLRLLRLLRVPPQTSPTSKLPAPSRLKLSGVPSSDVNGANIDSHSEIWNTSPWKFRKNPDYSPNAPSVLGLYTRGTALIQAPSIATNYGNHIGMWSYYGGSSDSRIYSDYSKVMLNRAHLGSTISPQTSISSYKVYNSSGTLVYSQGFTLGRFAMYDWDFLNTPPPFWIAPAGTAPSTTQLVVQFGAIYEAVR
jgi:hypothetical protein